MRVGPELHDLISELRLDLPPNQEVIELLLLDLQLIFFLIDLIHVIRDLRKQDSDHDEPTETDKDPKDDLRVRMAKLSTWAFEPRFSTGEIPPPKVQVITEWST